MTLVWLGSNGLQNYWQGLGNPNDPTSDIKDAPAPRSGDLYLDINITPWKLYSYDVNGTEGAKWHPASE